MADRVCHLLDRNLAGVEAPYCGGQTSREPHSLRDCILLGHERCAECIRVGREKEKPPEPRVLVEATELVV